MAYPPGVMGGRGDGFTRAEFAPGAVAYEPTDSGFDEGGIIRPVGVNDENSGSSGSCGISCSNSGNNSTNSSGAYGRGRGGGGGGSGGNSPNNGPDKFNAQRERNGIRGPQRWLASSAAGDAPVGASAEELFTTNTMAASATRKGYEGSTWGNMLLKLLFYTTVTLQVVLWPSIMTITFASVIGIEILVNLCIYGLSVSTWSQYAVLLMHNHKVTLNKYLFACAIEVYLLVFFTLFVSHESRVQPAKTFWLDSTVLGKYTFDGDKQAPVLPGADVWSTASKDMRSNPFAWPRTLEQPAIILNGTLPSIGAGGSPVACDGQAFDCYSAKLASFAFPEDKALLGLPPIAQFVPMLSQFYSADIIVSPPRGQSCITMEVYRVVLDAAKNVVYGLDYPAAAAVSGVDPTTLSAQLATMAQATGFGSSSSSSGNGGGNNGMLKNRYNKCGLFGNPLWCLWFQHAFTEAQYAIYLQAKCLLGKGQAVIRLPQRGVDVEPMTGMYGQDVLLVTPGSSVQIRWTWHEAGIQQPLLNSWEQTASSFQDTSQTMRDASDSSSVCFKYAVAVIPVLILWYYLAVTFRFVVQEYQIPMTYLFVLFPSVLLFISVGAWLPAVGCAVCMLAIEHTPPLPGGSRWQWSPIMRHSLLFITAVCNSIQLIWLSVLIQQAGWSAFWYDSTLAQLTEASSKFIVVGTPMWVGLILPVVLLINVAFLLGAALCVAMEFLSWSSPPKAQPSSSAASSAVSRGAGGLEGRLSSSSKV